MQESYNDNPPDALERIFQGPINWMNLLIVGINILVFAVMELLGDTQDTEYMIRWGAAYTPLIWAGEWYRLFTSMFLHFGFTHLLNNMVLLLFMGDTLEELTGKWKYLLIYLGGGLAGNLLSFFMESKTGTPAVSAGASGAVFAVIGAILVILIKHRGRIKDMTASQLLFITILMIYYGLQSTGVDNTAHVGGLLGGMLLAFLLYRKRPENGVVI